MDLFNALHHRHDEIRGILHSLQVSAFSPSPIRDRLFNQFQKVLYSHLREEDYRLFPFLRTDPELSELVMIAMEEHALINHLLCGLDLAMNTNELWNARVNVIKRIIENHIDDEENDLYTGAKLTLSQEQIILLDKNARYTSLYPTLRTTVPY